MLTAQSLRHPVAVRVTGSYIAECGDFLRLVLAWRMNRRQGFLCRRTASMEQAADRTETAAADHYFSSPTENLSVPVCIRPLESVFGLPEGGAI